MSVELDKDIEAITGKVPETIDSRVGTAVKSLRQNAKLTLSELSEKSGISLPMISKIERGQVSASLNTLDQLASALGVDCAHFLVKNSDQNEVSYVAAGQGINIHRSGVADGTSIGHSYQLVGHVKPTYLDFEPYQITLQQGICEEQLVQHIGVEYIHVLEGEMIYQSGGKKYTLSTGDNFTYETTTAHGPLEVLSKQVCYVLVKAIAL